MGQSNKFGTVIVSVPRRLVNARSNTYLFIHGGSKMSIAIRIRKSITFLVIMTFFLTACSADSLVEIENKDAQFQEVNKQLKDLKQIKVKGMDVSKVEKMKDIVYKNYFRRRKDTKHQEKEGTNAEGTIVYKSDDMYQLFGWSNTSVEYAGEFFGEEYNYKGTDDAVIEKETKLLLKRLGLRYNDKNNGYAIGKKMIHRDNSVEVHLKKYVEGKEISLAASNQEDVLALDEIDITFGDDQVIAIDVYRLTETVEVKKLKEDALVNNADKAYKLMTSFVNEAYGLEKKSMDTVWVSYAVKEEDNGTFTMRPVVEFYDKGFIGRIIQVDVCTKGVESALWASPTSLEQ